MTCSFERVLLVGFMGCGKTHVGKLLAGRLGWSFRDFDQEIQRRAGLSIPEIFCQHGEGFFRDLEGQVGLELLRERNVVLASGGGWPATPGRMESLDPATFSVWLQVTPEEAIRRSRRDGPTRPKLAADDPLAAAVALLKEREPFYSLARVILDSSGTGPDLMAKEIERLMHELGRG